MITPRCSHQMETFSALLALCAGNSPVTGEFPAQRPVARGSDVFFDLGLNKWCSKQSLGWWFETPSPSLWRRCNAFINSKVGWDAHYIFILRMIWYLNWRSNENWINCLLRTFKIKVINRSLCEYTLPTQQWHTITRLHPRLSVRVDLLCNCSDFISGLESIIGKIFQSQLKLNGNFVWLLLK